MNTYICRRDGNALEWRTHPYQPGGSLCCWQCEQRVRNGLPLLPEREETPIEELKRERRPSEIVARYAMLTKGIGEARIMDRALTRAARERERRAAVKAARLARLTTPEHLAFLDRIRPAYSPEHVRKHWQKKAVQLGLVGVA